MAKFDNNPKVSRNTEKESSTKNKPFSKKNILYFLLPVVITFIVYIPSIKNDFIKNWDDGGYILEHDRVHNLNAENVKAIFFGDKSFSDAYYKGNYHPLTTLFYAVEYSFVKDSPMLYHINNLIFHLLNVFLVYWLVFLFSKRLEIAAIAAVFFGIHPMHVESVAWISERKDVLYSFFFLLALIFYHFFVHKKENKTRNYVLVIVLFFLSLLSKSAAVILPVVLLLFDFYWKRKFDYKLFLEKTPFFLLSLGFGVTAILSQSERGAIQDLAPLFSILERLMIASYSFMVYICKFFAPVYLKAMYPYPNRIDNMLPTAYLLAPIFVVGFALIIWWSRKYGRDYIFGALFFLINIILVIQLLPVGGVILSERYTYIPYIGLFFIIGKIYANIASSKDESVLKYKNYAKFVLVVGVVIFSVFSWQRINIWKNGEILFTDLVKKDPNIPTAYNNLGFYYYQYSKEYDKAFKNYSKAISIDPNSQGAYANRAMLYQNIFHDYDKAVKDFTKSIELRPDKMDAWIGRAGAYSSMNKYDLSIMDFNKYLSVVKDNAKAYLWRGIAEYNKGKLDDAMKDFEACLDISPEDNEGHYWKGLVLYQRKQVKDAIAEFDLSLQLNPEYAQVYSWRGFAEQNAGLLEAAVADYTMAIKYSPKDCFSIANRSQIYFKLKKYNEAFNDAILSQKIGCPLDKNYFFNLKKILGK